MESEKLIENWMKDEEFSGSPNCLIQPKEDPESGQVELIQMEECDDSFKNDGNEELIVDHQVNVHESSILQSINSKVST